MKILLSPAKSINEQVEFSNAEFTTPAFAKEAKQLVGKLKKLNSKSLMDTMHVSKDIADLNVHRFKNWHLDSKLTESVKPAGFLFTGEVYRGLDLNSFSMEELLAAQHSIRILSGLYGVLKPMDLIYPYRLEMGTKFSFTEEIKNLYQFWGEKIAKQLQKELQKDEVVINLASSEYSKAALLKSFKNQVITPVFKEFKNGEYKIVMMYAKHARGRMAQSIVKEKIEDAELLKAYSLDGYSFSEQLSTDTEWVFVR